MCTASAPTHTQTTHSPTRYIKPTYSDWSYMETDSQKQYWDRHYHGGRSGHQKKLKTHRDLPKKKQKTKNKKQKTKKQKQKQKEQKQKQKKTKKNKKQKRKQNKTKNLNKRNKKQKQNKRNKKQKKKQKQKKTKKQNQKKKVVFQGGKNNIKILVKAGSQPYQKQWVYYVETVGDLGTNEQKTSLQR